MFMSDDNCMPAWLQVARADELADEAMIKCTVATKQRDDAEAALAVAAREKVAALLHVAELTSRLHARGEVRSAGWVRPFGTQTEIVSSLLLRVNTL